MSEPHLSLILPAFDEAASIVGVLDATRDYLDRQPYDYEILVGADGDDGTRELAAHAAAGEARIHVFGGPQRRGKGRAVREGVARARGGVIAYADADGKVPPREIGAALASLADGWDVVIGSRRLASSRVQRQPPLHRRLGSLAFTRIARVVAGVRGISDTQCGFKFFRAEAARAVFARQECDGYMFDVEILGLAQILGYRLREIPIVWRDDGDTRFDPFAGSWRNARDLWHIRARLRRARRELAAAAGVR